MSLASRPASRWAVSARTNGEVLTAGIGRSELELVVLGIPAGFSPHEIEGWLHDLAGVAVETSRVDSRSRAIPALMHHALTGLLFSHSELWDKLDSPRPCSSAFVDLPDGAAFGWFGDARVHVLVDGDPVEPQWVRVRDEDGREARAAVFAPGSDIVVTLEYWPGGEDGGAAPASLEAEWMAAAGAEVGHEWPAPPAAVAPKAAEVSPAWFASAAAETAGVEPSRVSPPVEEAKPGAAAAPPEPAEAAPAPASFAPYPELPETLPAQQPGLAAHDFDQRRDASPQWPAAGVPELVVPLSAPESAPDSAPREVYEAPMPSYPEVFSSEEPGPARASAHAAEPARAPAPRKVYEAPMPSYRDVFAPEEPEAARESAGAAEPARTPEPPAFSPASAPAARAHAPSRPAAAPAAPAIGESRASAAPRPPHPVARWLARVMKWGKPEPRAPEPGPSPSVRESTPVSAYDSLLSESVPPTTLEQTTIDLSTPPPGAPARAGGTLRPAGITEILGAPAPGTPGAMPISHPPGAAASKAAEPAGPPSGSIAINEKLQALLREIEAAEAAAALPVLSPELPPEIAARALEIDHEPVGADEAFGIPPLPSALAAGPPEEDRIPAIPTLPSGGDAAHPPTPRPFPVAPPSLAPPALAGASPAPFPAAPPGSAIVVPPVPGAPVPNPVEIVAEAPPVLRVALPSRAPADLEPVVVVRATPPAPPPAAAELAGPEPGDPLWAGPPPPAPAEGTDAEPLFPVVTRRARTLEGPEPVEARKLRLPPRAGLWAGGIVAVFVLGWLVGGFSNPGADRGGPVMAALRAVGIGGAQFSVSVNSSPGGAQIEIDGKPQPSRTPATIELPPGEHVVRLVMPGLGSVEVPVKGRRGEKLSVDESLNGSLEILDTDARVPIAVSIDGKSAGYAPLKVESLAPGLHEIGFTGPGMPAWAQTVQVEVRGATQMVARPMTAPANGVIQAQATLNDEQGASPLPGAQVYVDGELKGVTPLSIELPRGPHSLRVVWRGETAPIQVIDLPGGNQRFASFNFGLDLDAPLLTPIGNTRTFTAGQPKVVSASVEGLTASDVHEAWLHVQTPEGLWRRYQMTLLRGAGGLVVTSVFPDNVFDKQGVTRWYVRVVTPQGDETYSEVQRSSLVPAGGAPARPRP